MRAQTGRKGPPTAGSPRVERAARAEHYCSEARETSPTNADQRRTSNYIYQPRAMLRRAPLGGVSAGARRVPQWGAPSVRFPVGCVGPNGGGGGGGTSELVERNICAPAGRRGFV